MTSGIIEILIENATIQTLIGQNVAGDKYKVYPVVCPQGENQPYITVYKGGAGPLPSLSKELASSLDYPTVTVVAWAKNFRKTELIFEAVRAALDNQAAITDAGYIFSRIWLIDSRELYDNDAELYANMMTFGIELKR